MELNQQEFSQLAELIKKQRFNEAVKKTSKLMKRYPNSAFVLNFRGIAQTALNNNKAALACYDRAIKLNSRFADPHYNISFILMSDGQFDAAIEKLKTAITLNPKFFDAYLSLGLAYTKIGDLERADATFRKALGINSSSASLHNNIGNLQLSRDDPDKAISSFSRAVDLNPRHSGALANLGVSLQKCGHFEESLDPLIRAIILEPENHNTLKILAASLVSIESPQYDDTLEAIIPMLLQTKGLVRPKEISYFVTSFIKSKPEIKLAIKNINKCKNPTTLMDAITSFVKSPTALSILKTSPICDVEFEQFLSKVRSQTLLFAETLDNTNVVCEFLSALAQQCYLNEYVYAQDPDQVEAVSFLQTTLQNFLSKGEMPEEKLLALFACFRPLTDLNNHAQIENQKRLAEIFQTQVEQPKTECILKDKIPSIGVVSDEVSKAVRSQYEQNPYPRWVNTSLPTSARPIFSVLNDLKLDYDDSPIKSIDVPKILIAGSGTGQHALNTAQTFLDSDVLVIDLSLSSLAYAKRMSLEFNIRNIKFLQCDILDISEIKQQFDLIECCGVLHHMRDPLEGWSKLTNVLKPNGMIKVALYSKLARSDVSKIREEIDKAGVNTNGDEMRNFRKLLIDSSEDHHKRVQFSDDFFCLSEFRDLLFHEHEHLFSLTEIKDAVASQGLKFCGFQNRQIVKLFEKHEANNDSIYNLESWDNFEKQNPSIFSGMYEFWCQKLN